MSKLNPCTDCGDSKVQIDMSFAIKAGVRYRAICRNCDKSTDWRKTEDEAVREWNGTDTALKR